MSLTGFILGTGALLLTGMAGYLVRNRTLVGARLAAFATAAGALYIVASQLMRAVETPSAQYLAIGLFYSAAALLVPATLAFVLYAALSRTVPLGGWLALLAVPAISIVLVWTNPYHEWMWSHPPVDATGHLLLVPQLGLWARWIYLPAQWGALAIAAAVLVLATVKPFGHPGSRSRLTRVEAAITLVAVVAPFLVNVYSVAIAPNPEHGQSRTAGALAISSVILLVVFFRLEIIGLERTAYQAVVRSWGDGFMLMDARDSVIRINQAAAELLAIPLRESVGKSLDEVVKGEPSLREIVRRRGEIHEEVAVDGDRHRSVTLQPIYTRSGEYRGRTLVIRDITERRRAELAVRESETLLRSIVDHSPNGVIRLRPIFSASAASLDFECTFANPAAGYYLGIDHKDLVGTVISETVPAVAPMLLPNLLDALRQRVTLTFDVPVPVGAGNLWYRVIASPVSDDLSVTVIDVTDERLRRLEAEGAAAEDPLTGLLNRRGLETAVQRLPDGLGRPTPSHALLYLDLDDFKQVNDRYGHTAGDHVLREFGQRLRATVRELDVVARVGGDEFVIILVNAEPEATEAVVDRLLLVSAQPYRVPGGVTTCPASIGVARMPRQGQLMGTVIQAADAAMYQAKASGGGYRVAGAYGRTSGKWTTTGIVPAMSAETGGESPKTA